MATLTPPRELTRTVAPPSIVHPLTRLRRAIQTYVIVEGLAIAAAFTCIWFWMVFVMDWGMFQLFGLDYLREGSTTSHAVLRTCFLVLLGSGLALILGYKLVYRLLAAFRESSLALVLERRFPGILGDRLVTAVELADLDAAERLGYSRAMIEETSQAAAGRVDRVSLRLVFNWSRLVAACGFAVILLLTVVAMALFATDTFAIWAERDVLLRNTYWPRAIILDLPDFRDRDTRAVPHGGELRVPIRAWKWVVATRETPEGWRQLVWSDLLPNTASSSNHVRPWELAEASFPIEHHDALPDSWRKLPLDQIEVQSRAAGASMPTPESQTYLTELGLAIIEKTRERIRKAQSEQKSVLDDPTLALLPKDWRDYSLDTLDDYLRASQALTPTEVKRLQGLLGGVQLVRADGAQGLAAAFADIKPPVLTTGLLQRVAMDLDPQTVPLTFSQTDWQVLPANWRDLSARELENRLEDFSTHFTPEQLGEFMRIQLVTLFEELDGRATLSHMGHRCWFRQLTVPNDVTIDFEQVLSEEEKATVKARLGRHKVVRQAGTNEYAYEFKKVDRPTRFRVVAGGTSTPWYRIDVKPLPTLRRLIRYQDELGYLHGSNERVATGPLAVTLDGEESQLNVPAGTRLRLEAECYKPLRWVRVSTPGQQEHRLWAKRLGYGLVSSGQAPTAGFSGPFDVLGSWAVTGLMEEQNPYVLSLTHEPDSDAFTLKLRELGSEDLKLKLDFEDLDGIIGTRRLNIAVVTDKEPEFKKAQPEIVKRKMITAQAIIPFSGHIHDDHGLLGLQYEVAVESLDRKTIKRSVFPFRQFRAMRVPDAFPENLQFEKRDQVTLRRMLAGPLGEVQNASLTLSQLPLVGPLAWGQPPALEIPQNHVFEFRVIPASDKVLSADTEFFDTLLLRPTPNFLKPEDSGPPPLAVPYRLVIRLVARDNRVQSDGAGNPLPASQTSRSPETFEFQVVSEEEVLIENGKREEDLRDRCEAIITNLKKVRVSILKRLRDDFENKFNPGEGAYDFRRAAADAQDALKNVREGREAADTEVAQVFREIYRELALNRCQEAILVRIDRKICRPLEATLQPGQHFAKAEEAIDALAKGLEMEKDKTPSFRVDESIDRTDQLIARLEDILTEMKKLIEFNEAVRVLKDLIDQQIIINKESERKREEERKKELKGENP